MVIGKVRPQFNGFSPSRHRWGTPTDAPISPSAHHFFIRWRQDNSVFISQFNPCKCKGMTPVALRHFVCSTVLEDEQKVGSLQVYVSRQPDSNCLLENWSVAMVEHTRLVLVSLVETLTYASLQPLPCAAGVVKKGHTHKHIARAALIVLSKNTTLDGDVQIASIVAWVDQFAKMEAASLGLSQVESK